MTFIAIRVNILEVLYESKLTVSDLINRMKELGIGFKNEIVCDTARPEIIEDLRRSGYNAREAIKAVKAGIDSVKSSELFIHKESLNLVKEMSSYKWKTNGDITLDEPVKYPTLLENLAPGGGLSLGNNQNKLNGPYLTEFNDEELSRMFREAFANFKNNGSITLPKATKISQK